MKHSQNIGLSVRLLTAHPLRTTLSILAVVLGVGILLVMVSIGDGMRASIRDLFRSMGTNLVMIKAGKLEHFGGHPHQESISTSLVLKDVEALRKGCPDMVRGAGGVMRNLKARYGAMVTQTFVEGMEDDGFAIRNLEVARGRSFDAQEDAARRPVAILGPTVVKNLFGEQDPLGQHIILGTLPFRVVGVTKAMGTDMGGRDQDDIIFVPLQTGMRRLFKMTWIETIFLEASGEDRLYALEEQANAVLRKRHHIGPKQDDDFTVMNQSALLAGALEASTTMTNLVLAVAGISMLVAGIGILAVMLMAVRERRWEIGLRRAIGARRGDILLQFLSEAAMLSLGGGLLGVAVGSLCIWACNSWDLVRADYSVPAALGACALSVVTGVIFGIYPARKAAAMEPVEAINQR
jgi:putative ABC transport system permease protein